MSKFWGQNPVKILTAVQAALALGMGFGLHITIQQFGLIMAFTATMLGLFTDTQVTPMATLPDHVAAAVNAASDVGVPKIALVPPPVVP
jgi:hypothetical protein